MIFRPDFDFDTVPAKVPSSRGAPRWCCHYKCPLSRNYATRARLQGEVSTPKAARACAWSEACPYPSGRSIQR